MDSNLIASLKNKIDTLEDSISASTLSAVALHIDSAGRHLIRGQQDHDSSAYSDAVYRSNQAFDCCIKEAYRALGGRNPSAKSLSDIENYLTHHKIFRSRILKQFNDYREEWRKLANHDNPLTFDQSEAFMAIASVSSFAVLLIDQINEHRSYLKSQARGKVYQPAQQLSVPLRADLLSKTVGLVQQFCASHAPLNDFSAKYTEQQLIAAVQGFLSSVAPELSVMLQGNLPLNNKYRAALIIIRGREKVLFELKHSAINENQQKLLFQTERDMSENGIRYGILFCCSKQYPTVKVEERPIDSIRGKLVVFSS